MTRPVAFTWEGDCMKPLHPRIADREYVVGERYMLAPFEQRSIASHNHEFAWLHEAWASLPEHEADKHPSAEHLRKWALIQTGYSNSQSIVCSSKAEALRVAAFIRPMDEFSVVIVHECVVTRYTAKSQSRRAMGAKEFQESKEKIMEYVAGILGVTTDDLKKVQEAA